MTQPRERSPLGVAAEALSEAEEDLIGLPTNDEVRDLQRRWHALRTVLHGVVVERVPTITPAQESTIVNRAVGFAREVAALRRRLRT
jgi:negative regulator of sigma E activity